MSYKKVLTISVNGGILTPYSRERAKPLEYMHLENRI